MNRDETVDETVCPIARTLSVVGDRWTLLIMRELAMENRRFDELQAQTGMSPTLLSTRLKRLEELGVIERRMYSERPQRFEYHATEMGLDLDPVLVMLRAWGMKWTPYDNDQCPSISIIDKETRKDITGSTPITAAFRLSHYDAALSPEFETERNLRRHKFLEDRRAKSAKG